MNNSKPCYHCIELLREMGVKTVCYSVSSDTYSIEAVKTIKNDHITFANRKCIAKNQ